MVMDNVSRHTDFSPAELNALTSRLTYSQAARYDGLLRAGQPARKIFYVLSGALRESLSLTAEERYLQFLKKYPQILPHVTQKQIASYLGPEFLSLIRSKLRKRPIS